MRVAVFSETIDVTNGHGNITHELCMALHAKGIELTLFLPSDRPAKRAYPFPVRAELPPHILRIYTPKALGYFFGTVDLSGFDLIHNLFAAPYAFFALRMSRRYKIPFIMGGQGTYAVLPLTYPIEGRMLRAAYKRAKEIIVPSEFTKRMIIQFAKTSLAPISIIHNGVNYERFASAPAASELKAKYAGKKILLTVGGLKSRKGQDLVIRALPAVLKKHPDVYYLMVGPVAGREDLAQIARANCVDGAVEFCGAKQGEELVNYFYVADLYVHTPHMTGLYFEGFGIVYLEASACSKAIVATDAGGIKDAVIDGTTGLVAPDEDVAGVADRINELLDNPQKAMELGENGRAYAKAHDWPVIAEQFRERYTRYVSLPK